MPCDTSEKPWGLLKPNEIWNILQSIAGCYVTYDEDNSCSTEHFSDQKHIQCNFLSFILKYCPKIYGR